ncbi:hypothetical protein D3C72_2542420 [compost metagenome]
MQTIEVEFLPFARRNAVLQCAFEKKIALAFGMDKQGIPPVFDQVDINACEAGSFVYAL